MEGFGLVAAVVVDKPFDSATVRDGDERLIMAEDEERDDSPNAYDDVDSRVADDDGTGAGVGDTATDNDDENINRLLFGAVGDCRRERPANGFKSTWPICSAPILLLPLILLVAFNLGCASRCLTPIPWQLVDDVVWSLLSSERSNSGRSMSSLFWGGAY